MLTTVKQFNETFQQYASGNLQSVLRPNRLITFAPSVQTNIRRKAMLEAFLDD